MPTINDKDGWFFSHGGAEPGTDTQLVVQNNRPYTVRVIDINVLKQCTSPLHGTLFYAPDAGADSDVQIGFNLDSYDTDAETADGPGANQWRPGYFANYTVSIQPGAQQVFSLRTFVTKYSCSFRYRVTLLNGTQKTYQTIGDGDQPFRVSALTSSGSNRGFAAYQIMYAGGVANPQAAKGAYARVNPARFSS